MNLRAVRWLLGSLCLLLAATLLVPAGVSLGYGELAVARGFAVSALLTSGAGGLLMLTSRGALSTPDRHPAIFRREGLTVVALAWLVASLVGALPFVATGTASFVDALFESISGFTTTGASIFAPERIDRLSRGIAFWRCFSHWIGGIGIVVVFVAILPTGGRSLFRSEGRDVDHARIRDNALALLRVYVVLTALHALLLWVAGLDVFDALIHSFSSLATGGFSNRGSSIAYYDSPLVEAICIVFMVCAGTNFALWDAIARHGPRRALARAARSSELRAYLGLIVCVTLVLALVLWFWGGSNGAEGSDLPNYSSFLRCVRDATFSLVSVQTCTGYATADFDRWPAVCRMLLMAAVFVGACGGSTGGGLKVFRLVLVWRAALAAVRSFARPRAVEQVVLDGQVAEPEAISSALRYFVLCFLAVLVGSLLLALFGSDTGSAISGAISCLSNAGPGLSTVGPAAHYGHLAAPSKLVLCALMILGRLEFYALVALFLPGFWRR